MLRLAQITDIHIPADPGLRSFDDVHQVEPREQFSRVLAEVCAYRPDYLILSGDLAYDDGEPEAYAWLRKQLDASGLPSWIMAGNHDRVETLCAAFAIDAADVQDGLYYYRDIAGLRLIFMDSSSYSVSTAQLNWLLQHSQGDLPVWVFIHHPPVYCGARYLDSRHALRNITQVWPVLSTPPAVQHIFCGHYHTARSLEVDGKQIHLTPATLMQIDTYSPGFQVASTCPGWRSIEWDGQQMTTQARFISS